MSPKLLFLFIILTGAFKQCVSQKHKPMSDKHPYTNRLIHESSPYLLQHAHNPVDWYPWGKEAFEKARKENKLVIISIGYAACHWCHVMEHESFEDTATANLMNKYFVSVKVDREEHPDVDKIYMQAVQLMTGHGGWPLNVVALPDGQPVWGGTYFPRDKWQNALRQLAEMWQKEPDKFYKAAEQLEKGIRQAENQLVNIRKDQAIDTTLLSQATGFWLQHRDKQYGGFNRAPKFPMPSQYRMLLRAAYHTRHAELMQFVRLTLDKMMQGGIYDHVNGGFARYSTDKRWHIPHFEKMLYDNAQLLSLYANAYKMFGDEEYRQVIDETARFVERELRDSTGAFYSSLDADSRDASGRLTEGAYYVFTRDELQQTIGNDFPLFEKYYNINDYGLWEDGKYHLIRTMSDREFVSHYNISLDKLREKVRSWKQKLYALRQKRARPRLDDKTLTSWNALMIEGLTDAYEATGNKHYLDLALQNAHFLYRQQIRPGGGLWHTYKNGQSKIPAYLDDYALLISASLRLFETTGDTLWFNRARQLTGYVQKHFYNPQSGLFYYTENEANHLIIRPVETDDNVIPSSNAVMAINLFRMGSLEGNAEHIRQSRQMLLKIQNQIKRYPPGYYQWLQLWMNFRFPFYEVAITGPQAADFVRQMRKVYLPHTVLAWSVTESDFPLLQNRFVPGRTLIYICRDGACKLPLDNPDKAVEQMREGD